MRKALIICGFIVLLLIVIFSFPFFSGRPSAIPTEDDAINAVINLHPELATYKNTSLPPSSIETKQVAESWYIGFIQRGSGLPGILNAQCYQVTPENVVTIGTYTRETDRSVENIVLETCQPLIQEQPTPTATTPTPSSTSSLGKCYIGGCSSQLCSDQPDLASTCEYRAEYACYKSATCKRQPDGKCGWTKTPELTACLLSP